MSESSSDGTCLSNLRKAGGRRRQLVSDSGEQAGAHRQQQQQQQQPQSHMISRLILLFVLFWEGQGQGPAAHANYTRRASRLSQPDGK